MGAIQQVGLSYNMPNISRHLHLVAGLLLLLFATSAFMFVSMPYNFVELQLQNLVFPMFINKTVYLMGGCLELVVGVICLNYCGHRLTNVCILFFVGIISLYRWAFFYNGGTECNCLGFLSKVLHVSKGTGKDLPVIALAVIALTTVPWCISEIKRLGRGILGSLAWILLLAACQAGHADGFIEIRGEYQAATYNPSTPAHEKHRDDDVHATFAAQLSDNRWSLIVTNVSDGRSSKLWFDGTNIFTLNDVELGGEDAGKHQLVATMSPSKYYFPGNEDYLHISFLWLAYGLSPRIVETNDLGLVDIPLPWRIPHYRPEAYGWKWLFTPSDDGRFISSCTVVRDKALDLPDAQEFLRPGLVYPTSVAEMNRYKKILGLRKRIPNGFRVAAYECKQWEQTNGWSVPVAAEAKYYFADAKLYTNSWFEGSLQASEITVSDGDISLPQPVADTAVVDYRYRKFDGTHLYRGALYKLNAGDSWKSANDPALLAEADSYLKHGPRYDDLLDHWKRSVTWLALAAWVALTCIVTGVLYAASKNKQTKTKST
jgi:hypothetical protein